MESHYPVEVIPLPEYRILITFDNDERRIFNVEPYLEDSFFAPLRNQSIFRSVRVNPLTVEWAGGIDICPDELYYNSDLV